jgi:hypothetical protein
MGRTSNIDCLPALAATFEVVPSYAFVLPAMAKWPPPEQRRRAVFTPQL